MVGWAWASRKNPSSRAEESPRLSGSPPGKLGAGVAQGPAVPGLLGAVPPAADVPLPLYDVFQQDHGPPLGAQPHNAASLPLVVLWKKETPGKARFRRDLLSAGKPGSFCYFASKYALKAWKAAYTSSLDTTSKGACMESTGTPTSMTSAFRREMSRATVPPPP